MPFLKLEKRLENSQFAPLSVSSISQHDMVVDCLRNIVTWSVM